jgi:hypothetical protein
MKSYWLVLNRDEETKKVRIVDSLSEAINCKVNQYRISPIFPVSSSNHELPDFKKRVFIQFYFVHNPFIIMVEILRLFNGSDIKKKLWISHGLAAIIYITGDEKQRNTISDLFLGPDKYVGDKFKRNIIAIQEWKLDDTVLDPESAILLENKQPSVAIHLHDYSRLPPDLQNDILEFTNCIKTAIQLSETYTPQFTKNFKFILEEINNIIESLDWLFYPDSIIPDALSDSEDELKTSNKRLIRINELVEEVIQINSTLSYVISQGYAGIIPIEENPCQIHTYSLLGVGTAHKSLHTFYKYVSNVFSKNQIDIAMDNYYNTEISPKMFGITQPYIEEWRTWNIDDFILKVAKEADEDKIHPLMVYFSGRQGFSESLFSISAAIQSLYLGITSRWSIITSTHEIIHSHVSAIYYSLESTIKKFNSIDIRNIISDPEKYNLCVGEWLSVNILYFSDLYCQFEKLEQEDMNNLADHEQMPIGVSNELDLEYHNIATSDIINEIMTHTLDFHYFYESDPEIYLKQIWLSWASLPTTPSKVREYVLRSVSAVATLEEDTDVYIRIRNAQDTTRDVLKELIKVDKSINNEIYKAAIEMLENSPPNFELSLITYLYLSDLTRCFLFSENIQISLSQDSVKKKETYAEDNMDDILGLDYDLEPGKFEGEPITNPIAFVLSMVKREISTNGNQEFELDRYHTLWLYFVCCSLNDERSDLDVSN